MVIFFMISKLLRSKKILHFLLLIILTFIFNSCCSSSKSYKDSILINTSIPFNKFAKTLVTGDIILFHGNSTFDKAGDFLECSEWAHIGMIINEPSFTAPILWETTIKNDLEDIEFHTKKSGPQLVLLSDRLKDDVIAKEHSKWAIRKLELDENERKNITDSLLVFIKEVHKKDIQSALGVFWEIFEGKILGIKAKYKKIFCSELMALSYMKMGILSTKPPANKYMPKDFSSAGNIPFFPNRNITLGKQFLIRPILKNDSLKISVYK